MSHTPTLPGLVPTAVQRMVPVVRQVRLARNTYCLRLECPEIARRILPGQFFMVRVPGRTEPLLGRPFALFDTYSEPSFPSSAWERTSRSSASRPGKQSFPQARSQAELGNEERKGIQDTQPRGIDFGYIVVGKMTSLLATLQPGDAVELWGPLGNGFPPPPSGHLVIVAGGIGHTPFLAVAREALGLKQYGDPPRQLAQRPSRITMCYGARSAEYLAGLDEFRMDRLDLRIATDDGTAGHHGFVTDLLLDVLAADRPDSIYCCGPEPMMRAVQQIALRHQVPCWLSLETPMACGFGACFSCVTRVRMENGEWDYRRVCVEGPVFPAEAVVL